MNANRRYSTRLAWALALAALATLPLLLTTPGASALDSTKPEPTCAGLLAKDAPDDNPDRLTQKSANLDLLGAFFKFDASKKEEATTINLIIKDLSTTVPAGSTGLNWTAQWNVGETTFFVRGVIDYTGSLVFEHGEVVPPIGGLVLPRYQPSGSTPGKLFEGPNGVIQIVIPASGAGKAGSKLTDIYAQAATTTQVVPNAIVSPTRGLSNPVDRIPDGTAFAPPYTVTPCNLAPAGPAAPGGAALPVTVQTKSFKAKQASKGKTIKVKLASAGKVTNLDGTLRGGSVTYATGKLAGLDGAGTLSLKVTRALKKGSYVLTLAGSDASGARGTTTAKIKVS